MISKDKMITVVNKYHGTVSYTIPELNIYRIFYPKESKQIGFGELEKLSFIPGGDVILKDRLEITDKDAVFALFNKELEPEYYYSEDDVKNLLINGSLDQFLDCLDFAPEVIKDMVKTLAIELPLNDMAKREAIKEKMGFDVTKAIEIRNTKYDGEEEVFTETELTNKRRTAPLKTEVTPAPSGRRYKPVNKAE